MSPLTRLYLAFSTISDPIWKLAHRRRLKRGKETPERLDEKYGRAPIARPGGRILWFHALSVGESLALLPLIEKALAELPDAHVVLTTSTATSAQALEKAGLPDRAVHVLAPIDTKRAVGRFLDHWSPEIAVFTELDFWPRLMVETSQRKVPMVLVNSRMTARSYNSRRKTGAMISDILRLFDRLLVQDIETFNRFKAMGADPKKISVVGVLKGAARPLPADDHKLAAMREVIGERPVWLAAATWRNEHETVLRAHRIARAEHPDALLIVAPRHVADGDDLERQARDMFDHVARRSRGDAIRDDVSVYVADTIGEMGLWYRIAPISFVGHSIDVENEGIEGKNPFEAAALGSAIVHGPAMSYFEESYDALAKSGAAREVHTAEDLAAAVLSLQDDVVRKQMTEGAKQVIAAQMGVLDNTWEVIRRALPD